MLDMDEVTEALSNPAYESESPKGEKDMQGEMGGHAEMMCQILMQLGRLDAKLDMLLDAESEDKAEKEDEDKDEAGPNPATYSNQLEFDITSMMS